MGAATPTSIVIYDACVLYPAPLRDLLISIAATQLFRARWTDRIHDEWIRNLLINRPDLTVQQLQRTRDLMNGAVLDCLVTGYEGKIDRLSLPDPNDRHVLAAAIHVGAAAVVTTNTRHFPFADLRGFGVEALHPDEFVVRQLDLDPTIVLGAIRAQRLRLRNPPVSADRFIDVLAQQRLPKLVSRLRAAVDAL